MKKVLIISAMALGLAGCNATVYPARPVLYNPNPYNTNAYYQPRPVVVPPQPYRMPPPRQCFKTWDRTPYGMVERVQCR